MLKLLYLNKFRNLKFFNLKITKKNCYNLVIKKITKEIRKIQRKMCTKNDQNKEITIEEGEIYKKYDRLKKGGGFKYSTFGLVSLIVYAIGMYIYLDRKEKKLIEGSKNKIINISEGKVFKKTETFINNWRKNKFNRYRRK